MKLLTDSKLIGSKIRQFLPFLFLSQASTILIVFVDGLVSGNFVGDEGLAAINVATPLLFILSLFTVIPQAGISSRLIYRLGRDSALDTAICINTGKRLIVLSALAVTIFQIPFPWIITSSLSLNPDIYHLSLTYMYLVMLTAPFGLISACGVSILSAYGRVSVITVLTVAEGLVNLLLDLLFTCCFGMGMAGIGLGTVLSTVMRCIATIIIIRRQTPFLTTRLADFMDCSDCDIALKKKKEWKEMLHLGSPNGINEVQGLISNWLLIWGLSMAMGDDALGCLSVRSFIVSITGIFIAGFLGLMKMIIGLQYGIGNFKECITVLRKTSLCVIVIASLISVLIFLWPQIAFYVFGYDNVSPDYLKAIRIFTLSLLFFGVKEVLTTFLIIVQKPGKASLVAFINGFLTFIPAFLILLFTVGGTHIWYAFLISGIISVIFAYIYTVQTLREETDKNKNKSIASYNITPDMGGTLSAKVERFAIESGLNEQKAYRLALCVDEIAGYSFRAFKDKTYIDIFLTIDRDDVQLVMIDNGKHFDNSILYEKSSVRELIGNGPENIEEIDRYISTDFALVNEMVKSVEYQWLWNMNHTTIRI